nr:MAG: hypothetical protein TU35_03640 [Thermoproteus sp. AZ2]
MAKVYNIGKLPVDLPGRLAANPGVILKPDFFAFQLLPGRRGDYAIVYAGGALAVIPDNARIVEDADESNITGSQIVNGLYFFGGGEAMAAQYATWSPCVYPTEYCAPYLAVYDGTLRVIKIPSGSCANMNLTGVAYDGEYYYAVGGGNYPPFDEYGLIHYTGVVVLNKDLEIAGYGLIDVVDDAGHKLGMYRSGPKRYVDGYIYSLAYDVERKGLLYLVKFSYRPSKSLCQRSPSIKPEYVATAAEDFDGRAIPLLLEDLSVAYWDGRYVKWRDLRVEAPEVPYIRASGGRLYVAYNADGEFVVESPVKYRARGMGFIDWTGAAIVFEGLSAGSRIYYVDLKP